MRIEPVHPSYRPDIDGLRAIAVSLVVAFHAFPNFVPGGFVGVDVFFVISGYLITGIIVTDLAKGTFSFAGFYARRVRRIFPALIVVLATCVAIGWFVLLPKGYSQFGREIVAGAGFVSNLLFWHDAGYFDAASELKPLLHLWSLGVEEQFYLFWPVGLWLMARARSNGLRLTVAVLITSFVLCLLVVRQHPAAAFYSPATRFWELMTGGALAQLRFPSAAPPSEAQARHDHPGWRDAQAFVGTLLLIAAAWLIDGRRQFPGAWALLPTVGAALLVSAGPDAYVNRRVLARPLATWLGLVSYPLYLWHWPLLCFARVYETATPPAGIRLGAVALAVTLAAGTYAGVERPLRSRLWLRARAIAVLSSFMAAIGLVGLALVMSGGLPARLTEASRRYANYPTDEKAGGRAGTCWLSETDAADAYASECLAPPRVPDEPVMVVWGDSHAARLFIGLRDVVGGEFRMAQYTRSSCPPYLEYPGLYPRCLEANDVLLRRITKLHPDVVVLFGYWQLYAGPGGDATSIAAALEDTIARLHASGVRSIIVPGPAPRWNTSLPDNLTRYLLAHPERSAPERTRYGLDALTALLDNHLEARIGHLPGVRYFSVYDALCNEDGCLTRIGNDFDALTTMDYGHLSRESAARVARQMMLQSDDFGRSSSHGVVKPDRIFSSIPAGARPTPVAPTT